MNKTLTGRLGTAEPNIQNIPLRTEEGRKIRAALLGRDLAEIMPVQPTPASAFRHRPILLDGVKIGEAATFEGAVAVAVHVSKIPERRFRSIVSAIDGIYITTSR